MDNSLNQNPTPAPAPNSLLPQPASDPENNSKPSKSFILILIVLITLSGGYFAYAKYQNLWPWQKMVQNPITPLNETANWTTYKNQKLGYQFEYPSNWYIEEIPPGYITLIRSWQRKRGEYDDPGKDIMIRVSNGKEGSLTGQETANSYSKEVSLGRAEYGSDVKVGVYSGKEILETGDKFYISSKYTHRIVLLRRDDISYEFSIFYQNPRMDIFNHIISSFKDNKQQIEGALPRLDNSTANWTTYRNDKYRFEVKYPTSAILTIDNLFLGAAGHQTVNEFPSDASYITIKVGRAFISICNTCGGLGLGVGSIRHGESVVLDGKTYNAVSFNSNANDYTSEITSVNLQTLEI